MEKIQLSMYDNCGEIEIFSTYGEISVQLMGFIAIYATFEQVLNTFDYVLSTFEHIEQVLNTFKHIGKHA